MTINYLTPRTIIKKLEGTLILNVQLSSVRLSWNYKKQNDNIDVTTSECERIEECCFVKQKKVIFLFVFSCSFSIVFVFLQLGMFIHIFTYNKNRGKDYITYGIFLFLWSSKIYMHACICFCVRIDGKFRHAFRFYGSVFVCVRAREIMPKFDINGAWDFCLVLFTNCFIEEFEFMFCNFFTNRKKNIVRSQTQKK